MSMKERMLNLIGLEPMTNRDRLVEEFGTMTGGQIYTAMSDNLGAVLIDDAKCAACHRLHGGECPKTDDGGECALTIEAWLDMPWEGTSILLRDEP